VQWLAVHCVVKRLNIVSVCYLWRSWTTYCIETVIDLIRQNFHNSNSEFLIYLFHCSRTSRSLLCSSVIWSTFSETANSSLLIWDSLAKRSDFSFSNSSRISASAFWQQIKQRLKTIIFQFIMHISIKNR